MSRSSISIDPPLVRGRDGHLYFVIAGRDNAGNVHNFYIPAAVNSSGWLIVLDERGRRTVPPPDNENLPDPRAVEGRFVAFKAINREVAFEGSYDGRTVYFPVTGNWFQKENDPEGRYLFGIKAAADVPDSRTVEYWALDNFLGENQTYHYRTMRELRLNPISRRTIVGLLVAWWIAMLMIVLAVSAWSSGGGVLLIIPLLVIIWTIALVRQRLVARRKRIPDIMTVH